MMRYAPPMVVKRYSNRRLYDTEESRYVTLDEIAERIRAGSDVRFVDAPTGADITQSFLAQIILEGRGAAGLLPVPLLYRLVRMGDDALAEFFGRYVTWALDVYLRMKQGARSMATYNPLAALPLAATDALARWIGATWGAGGPRGGFTPPPPGAESDLGFPPPPEPAPEPSAPATVEPAPAAGELAALRTELEALKAAVRDAMGPTAARGGAPAAPEPEV